MKFTTHQLVYPEGDTQLLTAPLPFNQLVDINGNLLALPLPTPRMIAYRTCRITTEEHRNGTTRSYHLEQLPPWEMEELSR